MDKNDKVIIEKFKMLLQRKFETFEIILFGSRARGDAEEYSDMDIAVILEKVDNNDVDYISECAWESGFEYGIIVVPIVFSKEEWEHSPQKYSLIVQAVKSDGIVV